MSFGRNKFQFEKILMAVAGSYRVDINQLRMILFIDRFNEAWKSNVLQLVYDHVLNFEAS